MACTGEAVRWVKIIFGECAYRYRWNANKSINDVFSVILGYLSILWYRCTYESWIVAQFPQLITNFKRGNADAISLWFIGIWLTGDFCNLVGGNYLRKLICRDPY